MPYPFLFHGWQDWQSDYSPLMTSSFNSRHASILRQSWGKRRPCLPMHNTAHTPTHTCTLHGKWHCSLRDTLGFLRLYCTVGTQIRLIFTSFKESRKLCSVFLGWYNVTRAWRHIVVRLKTNTQTSCYIVMRLRRINLICAAQCYGVNVQVVTIRHIVLGLRQNYMESVQWY